MRLGRVLLAFALASSLAIGAQAPTHLVMVSVDGLMPSTYTGEEAGRFPTLKSLKEQGTYAEGVIGVLPSVTYASHTTLITGVPPSQHGIFGNVILDPEGRSNGAWYWYASTIKVPTLIDAARSRGMTTAAISWPVSVGMKADYLVAEFWRSGSNHPSDISLSRALATPGLFEGVEAMRKRPVGWPLTDRDLTDFATYIVKTHKPGVLLLHLGSLDGAQHANGPGSARAIETLQQIDGYLKELREAVAQAGIADQTDFVIVSDHGFAPIEHQVQPNAAFRKEGLLTVNAAGTVTDWQAYFNAEGGAGLVYLKDPGDRVVMERVRAILDALKNDPANGIASIWSREELAKFGADPAAVFGVGMRPGFYSGAANDVLSTTPRNKGGHGFDPNLPELRASFIIAGPHARPGVNLGTIRMTQIAPTLAKLLGLTLSSSADTPIPFAGRIIARAWR